MSEEEEEEITTTTGEEVAEDNENEISIEEDFRGLWGESQSMQKKFMKLAAQSEEEKDAVSAKILRAIGGDLIPLIAEIIAASGSAFEEVSAAAAASEYSDEEGANLTDDELVQIYVTIASNEKAFSQLIDMTQDENAKKGLQNLVELNRSAINMLHENFGDDLVEAANEKLKEAAGTST